MSVRSGAVCVTRERRHPCPHAFVRITDAGTRRAGMHALPGFSNLSLEMRHVIDRRMISKKFGGVSKELAEIKR